MTTGWNGVRCAITDSKMKKNSLYVGFDKDLRLNF